MLRRLSAAARSLPAERCIVCDVLRLQVGAACAARTPGNDAQLSELTLMPGITAAPVCEAYAASQCPNRCYICTRLDGLQLCVPKNVAEKLAPMVFECVHARNNGAQPESSQASEAAAQLRSGGVPVPCDTFDANECQVREALAAGCRCGSK